ncbi:MAG: hypothetical protein IJJ33_15860, partial [Victivallales bacterium]|nr:hypothetical protein [Victivallales bacterium]
QTDEAADLMVTATRQNAGCRVSVELNPERAREPFSGALLLKGVLWEEGWPAQEVSLPMRWLSPDSLECVLPLPPGKVFLPVLADAKGSLRPLPPVIAAGNPEHHFQPAQARRFRQCAASTGGRERLTVDGLWGRIAREWRYVDATPALAALAILLLLLEVSQRIFCWLGTIPRLSLPVWHWPVWKMTRRKKAPTPPTEVTPPGLTEAKPQASPEKFSTSPPSLEDVLRAASRKNNR